MDVMNTLALTCELQARDQPAVGGDEGEERPTCR